MIHKLCIIIISADFESLCYIKLFSIKGHRPVREVDEAGGREEGMEEEGRE